MKSLMKSSYSVSDIYVDIISNRSSKSMKHWPINPQPKYMPTKFRIELHSKVISQYYLELFRPETMQLLGNT